MSDKAKEQTTETAMLYVLDTNAKPPCPVRRHDVLLEHGGEKTYEFKANKWTKMSAAHAIKFLCDEAFVVSESEGGPRIKPIITRPEGGAIPTLKPDECIARYEELLQSALLIRAQMKQGGELFSQNAKKADLIEFLMGNQPKSAGPAPEQAPSVDDVTDVTGEDMSEDELAGMFDGEEAPDP